VSLDVIFMLCYAIHRIYYLLWHEHVFIFTLACLSWRCLSMIMWVKEDLRKCVGR